MLSPLTLSVVTQVTSFPISVVPQPLLPFTAPVASNPVPVFSVNGIAFQART